MSKLGHSGVVALLTDFGLEDIYIGVVKGRILQELSGPPYPTFIDITHAIPPQDIKKAALRLGFSYKYFPKGTIFLVIVDPGVGTERKALLLQTENYYFIGPDNGVFTYPLKECAEFKAFEIVKEKIFNPPYSATFHGRDLFAPAVSLLFKGIPLETWTKPLDPSLLVTIDIPSPQKTPYGYRLSVIDVDRFGNLITNFPQELVTSTIKVLVNGKEVRMVRTYAEGGDGEIIALFGSEGFLEIAIKNSSAKELLGDPKIEVYLSNTL
uniref:SAM-dependent chlorinase/fluorinase n=1 Tax=Caldimicrobium thiodismutans TaxID=1653476 RepID=A0A832GMC0_9BACT